MMNKAFRETLSAIVSVNEQFARSTRIDGDSIDETGFIYSESIDMFLRTLIRHQRSLNKVLILGLAHTAVENQH